MRTRPWLATLGFVTLASACGGGGGDDGPSGPSPTSGTPQGSTSSSITVSDNNFTPKATTVTPGTTVTWTWSGQTGHNVTFDDNTASATQTSGTFARTFNAAGSYPYHCTVHGAAMSGSVTVR